METFIKEVKKVKMNKPILIEGLPGIGFVGKLVAETLIEELKAEKVAELYSPHFPHHVLMTKEGVVKPMKNELYLFRRKNVSDLLILVGETQAIDTNGQYEVNEKIIQYFKKKGGRFVITIGGYGTGNVTRNPRIFGAATDAQLVQEYSRYGIEFGATRGAIVGAAGLLLALAKIKGLKGVCIMGETHGGYIDAKVAKKVLNVLSKIIKVTVSSRKLEKKAKENEELVTRLEAEVKKEMPHVIPKEGLSYIR